MLCLLKKLAKERVTWAVLLVGLLIETPLFAQPNYNPSHVAEAMRLTSSGGPTGGNGLVVTIAHRGYHVESGCPENSVCSIRRTYQQNIEAIELDIKQSADGTPWVFHDFNLGRTTNLGCDSCVQFNPNKPINAKTNPDPLVSSVHDAQLKSYDLRDKNFKSTGYLPMSLYEALYTIRGTYPHMAVTLDIKTLDAVSRCADVVNQLGMASYVFLQFPATLIPGNVSGYAQYAKGVPWVPVVYAGSLDTLYNYHKSDNIFGKPSGTICGTADCVVQNWMDEIAHQPHFAFFNLQWKGEGEPMRWEVAWAVQQGYAHGNFLPVPDVGTNQYYRGDGTCCGQLNQFLSKTEYFGNETQDNRTSTSFQAKWFNSVTTDNALEMIDYTEGTHQRNTKQYF